MLARVAALLARTSAPPTRISALPARVSARPARVSARPADVSARPAGVSAALAAAAVVLAGVAVLLVVSRNAVHAADGSAAAQMAVHVTLMSGLAPLAAWWIRNQAGAARIPVASALLAATGAQAALLYLWHLPPGLRLGMEAPAAMAAMHVSLLVAAIWFWYAIFANLAQRRWRSLAALLVTGKVFCLLGVLLVLAPRSLYVATPASAALEDQQLAGLIMLAACPLTYLGAALVVTVRGIGGVFDTWPRTLDASEPRRR